MNVSLVCSQGLNVRYTGKSDIFTFFDSLGREIRSEFLGLKRYASSQNQFYNENIIITTEYDSLGRVVKVSEPYFSSETPHYTTSEYDALDRPISITMPNGNVIDTIYSGNNVTTNVTPADGVGGVQSNTMVNNALGQNIKTIDNDYNELAFEYDPFGNLVRTTDPDQNTVEIGYDIRGRKIKMNDPDQGIWTYSYYADGTLRAQTDAKNQTITNIYDVLARMSTRTRPDGTDSWVYDNCNYGIGKLCSTSNSTGFSEIYTYNNKGLPYTTTTKISGQPDMKHTYQYDSESRLETVTYPSLIAVINDYSPNGILYKVRSADLGLTLWEGTEYTARGQAASYIQGGIINTVRNFDKVTGLLDDQTVNRTGSGEISFTEYSWHSNGNLEKRVDRWKGNYSTQIIDEFWYDSLHRLDQYTTEVGGHQQSNISLTYDSLGNIEYKSDVGTYTYETGGTKGGPHAVSSITGKGNFSYDANGNLRTGDGRSIHYSSFNKPLRIVKGNHEANFDYGPSYKRYRRVDIENSNVVSRTYISGDYEKEIKTSGGTVERMNIGDFAIIERDSGTVNAYYTVRDQLGSLIATIKHNGTEDTRMSYDPWGKRRALASDNLSISITSSPTKKSFHLTNTDQI